MVTFWRNSLKVEKDEFEKELRDFDVEFEVWEKFDLAYIVKDKDSSFIMSLPGYEKGWLYIQNLSSMLGVLALDPLPGERVLDIAAAPGGKTALMSVLMKNQGEILANDLSKERIYKMKSNFKRLGVSNVRIMNKPGEMIWRVYPNHFDKVLADVPCSMDERVEVTKDRIKVLVPRQKRLLWSAFVSTRIGGRLVYSTCTSIAEENLGVIENLQKSEPVLAQLVKSFYIPPSEMMGTFFYAVIVKDTEVT